MSICDICSGEGGTHAFSCPKAVNEEAVVA